MGDPLPVNARLVKANNQWGDEPLLTDYFHIKIISFGKKFAITRKNDEILEYILQKGGDTVSFLSVLSIAIILLFVLFALYYYIAGKKEVPHHQLLEEEYEREE